jgi:alanine racemase
MKAWMEISEERLAENYRVVAAAAGGETDVLAVVKANAYGHGAERCAVVLARAGASWFGVADAQEGARVRRALDAAAFAEAQILVMCGLMPGDGPLVVKNRLTPIVWTKEQVDWLRGWPGLRVHVEVETGMGRQGCRPGAELEEVLDARGEAGLVLDGVMTHFCAAEAAPSERTQRQQARLGLAVTQVCERDLAPRWIHAGSSSSVDNPAQEEPWLEDLAKTVGAQAMVRAKLKAVMTWKTRVIDVRDVQPGESIGYNAIFTAKAAMRVALLPVGYSDGLRRELSGSDARPGGWVMIDGRDGSKKKAATLGRVSMNLTTVDVTGTDVRVGDEVVLLGDGVTADDHARVAGTISYEILCGVGKGGC